MASIGFPTMICNPPPIPPHFYVGGRTSHILGILCVLQVRNVCSGYDKYVTFGDRRPLLYNTEFQLRHGSLKCIAHISRLFYKNLISLPRISSREFVYNIYS